MVWLIIPLVIGVLAKPVSASKVFFITSLSCLGFFSGLFPIKKYLISMSLFLIRLNTCTYLSVLKLSWIKVSQGKAWKLKLLTPISPITWSLMSRPSEFFSYGPFPDRMPWLYHLCHHHFHKPSPRVRLRYYWNVDRHWLKMGVFQAVVRLVCSEIISFISVIGLISLWV